MSNSSKNVTFKGLVDTKIMELHPKTNSDQLYLNDSEKLGPKLAEMVTAINQRAKIDDVTSNIIDLKTYTDSEILTAKTESNSYAKSYTDTEVDRIKTESSDYTDTKSTETLNTAKGYTDSEVLKTKTSVNSYTDTKATETLNTANSYTDTEVSKAKTENNSYAKSYTDTEVARIKTESSDYTDTKATETLSAAKGYTDAEVLKAKTSVNSYTDTKADETLNTAKGYTDVEISSAKTESNSYADTKATETLSTAKSYTDTQIANLIDGAPTTLDTLKEIADAMADNENVVAALNESIGTKANTSDLASIAFTGSYSDLSGKPTIPSKTSQLTNDSGFKTTDNNTTYTLSKSGDTITLTGSDGSETSVTDSDTKYTHPSGDGNKHIPANGTSNGGKYLKATSTAGNYEWGILTKSDVTNALGYTPGTSNTNTTYSLSKSGDTITLTGSDGSEVSVTDSDTKYTHPSGDGNKHIPANGTSNGGKYLKATSTAGNYEWGSLTKNDVTTALGYTPPTTNTTYNVATHSALGLVKSGTDITVDSSGNVSVNDDSHNHVISNVDGLQSALDGKADSSHTHSYAGSSSAGGAANSATKLATPKTINNAPFDGSANIRIANSWNLSLGSTSNEVKYAIFARMSSSNATSNGGATLLVTDCGNFGGTLPGAWLIQLSNRGSVPTMDVTVIRPQNSGTVTFGYYKDTTNGYFYFGVYTTSYRSDGNITVLRNTGVTIQKFSDSTTAPDGWTAATVRTLQDANGTIANATSAGTSSKWSTSRNINGMAVDGTANRFNYGTCSTAAATAAKTVDCEGFVLATGSSIKVRFTVTNTASNPTLNVNSTGSKPIYYRNAVISAGYLAANKTLEFVYDGTAYQLVGEIDTITYDRIRYQQNIKCGSTAIVSGNIIVGKDGVYEHLKLGNAFDITYPILYAGGAGIAASGTSTTNYLVLPFTITTTQSITFTAYKPVYIKGNLSGTTFTPVSTTPLTQTIPTSADGYEYILLGMAFSTKELYLLADHPIFAYQNGVFGTIGSSSGENSDKCKFYISETKPSGLTSTDIWFHIQ